MNLHAENVPLKLVNTCTPYCKLTAHPGDLIRNVLSFGTASLNRLVSD